MTTIIGGMPHTLSSKERQALREHQLELQCSELRLYQTIPDAPQIQGPGVIRQNTDGELELTLYVTDEDAADALLGRLSRRDDVQAGMVIADDHFCDLTALDIQGRLWTATRLRPRITVGTGAICRARLTEIQSHYQADAPLVKRPSVSFEFAERVTLPFNQTTTVTRTSGDRTSEHNNLDVFKFSTSDYDFLLYLEEEQFLVNVAAKEGRTFPAQLNRRVVEALQFITARPLGWTLCSAWDNNTIVTTIRSRRSTFISSRLHPPIDLDGFTSEAVSHLFGCYLNYVCQDVNDHLHPISAQVRSMCHASMGAVETEALVTCTAIESLLPLIHQEPFQLGEEEQLWVNRAQAYFDTWGGPEELTGRVKGLLSQLHAPSATMRLRRLIAHGVITQQHLRAWNRLRPRLAHGVTKRSGSIQDLLDDAKTVLTLFYRLVFFIIGYRGVYTDYATRDWPLTQFELPSDEPDAIEAPASEE